MRCPLVAPHREQWAGSARFPSTVNGVSEEVSKPQVDRRVGVVVTAAGSGTRLGYGAPKALVPLGVGGSLSDDTCILAVALRQVAAMREVSAIVVTAPAQDLEEFRAVVGRANLDERTEVVEGGSSRQASVRAGLKQLEVLGLGANEHDVVLVHDAARALTPPHMMDRVVAAVTPEHTSVIPTLEVADTLKEVASEVGRPDKVVGSVDRTRMRIVQTPQGFLWQTLTDAHEQFADRGHDESTAATDDSTIVQWAGHTVWCVGGDDHAAKITTPRDLAVAQVLFAQTAQL